MAGRRKNGTGTIRERKDGRWEGRIIIGYDDNGKAKTKSVFGATKTECAKKLKELQGDTYHITGRLAWFDFILHIMRDIVRLHATK